MPIHNGTEWKSEKAWWVKVGGEWKKSTTIWKKVAGVWEKMTLSVAGLVSTLAGSGVAGDAGGVGELAEFNFPYGVAIDSGFSYIVDSGNNKIRKINLSTADVTTFAGNGTPSDIDGVGVLAGFEEPSGIAIDSGFAYLCDSENNKIKKIDLSTADVTTFAGSGTIGSLDGVGVLAEFESPIGITIDSGFAYVCDSGNNKIRKINLSTADVTTFAGNGTSGDADGIGTLAEFRSPSGVSIDSGFAYICDTSNHIIRKINLSTADVTTFAGSGTIGSLDGVGVLAEFSSPRGITINSGFAYVCDTPNHIIRRIDLSTADVTTFAGSGTSGDSDGVGVLAEFNRPNEMAIESGFAYVCDGNNNKIRKIVIG